MADAPVAPMPGTAPRVAVVIPFYQKSAGILTKAIVSALRQSVVSTIIVVDDASPVPARDELAVLMRQHPGRIVIIEQPNAGPAAARNNGLDHVPADTRYVAFLDSDDEWIDTHLANAVTALDEGYDFYFADHFQLNQTVSAFNRAKRIDVARHARIAASDHLHAYAGDMFDQILIGNIIGTSTVVYRFEAFPKLRFREEFVYAGEDYLFWLELSTLTKKIAFSSLCECTYGEGVNIFSGSGWGTEKSLVRIHHEMKFKRAVSRIFPLTPTQLASTQAAVRVLRRSFVADVLHRLAHRRAFQQGLLREQFKVDPQTFLYFLPLALSIVLKRPG
jgi:succinoglycan biosynthesis protein ExoW